MPRAVSRLVFAQHDARVTREIMRRRWSAMPRDVSRRCTQDAPIRQQQTRVDARVRHFAEADADIETFFLKTHRTVRQMQDDLHRRIARNELRHRRRYTRPPE